MSETKPEVVSQKTSGMAITSLIFGIISIVGGAFYVIPSILAVVFGHISLSACNKNPNLTGKGMGIAGLVMGWITIAGLVFIFFILGGLAALGAAATSANGY